MEKTVEERLEEVAKKSKNILYSPKIFDDKNEPKIQFYKFQDSQNGNRDIGVFILKYIIDDIPQEVIIGTLENEKGAFESAKYIKTFVEQQLKQNSNEKGNLTNLRKLEQYIENNKIPFNFTVEGQNIITYNQKENKKFRRTYYEKTNEYRNNSMECLYTPEDMEIINGDMEERKRQQRQELEKNEKWQKRRELILKNLTPEEKKLFLQGEKIAKIVSIKDNKKAIEEYKDLIADYLIESYEFYGNSENQEQGKVRNKGFEEYLNLKEKGIALDAKKILGDLQDEQYKSIQRENREPTLQDTITVNSLQNYEKFFDLISDNRESMARILALRITKIDFSVVKQALAKSPNSKELLEYIDLKVPMIDDVRSKDRG